MRLRHVVDNVVGVFRCFDDGGILDALQADALLDGLSGFEYSDGEMRGGHNLCLDVWHEDESLGVQLRAGEQAEMPVASLTIGIALAICVLFGICCWRRRCTNARSVRVETCIEQNTLLDAGMEDGVMLAEFQSLDAGCESS